MSYPNYVFSILAFIGFILALIPLRWHLHAGNTGTCFHMMWTAIACLNQFVNSVVWNGNVADDAPGWCDISVRIIVGASTAIPAASLCINRRLYHISCLQTVKISDVEKRRDMIVDFVIALGLPILFTILSYIPQGHRYNIFEDIGCVPVEHVTPIYILLVQVPPVAIGCVTTVYSILSVRALLKRYKQSQELVNGYTSMNTSRYFRLMCLAGVEVLLTVPLGSFMIYEGIHSSGGIYPWISWEDTHWDFDRHDKYPAARWRGDARGEGVMEFGRWLTIISSMIFFAFFGFAKEARHNYLVGFWAVVGWFGYKATIPVPSPSPRAQVMRSNTTFTRRRVTNLPIAIAPDATQTSPEGMQPRRITRFFTSLAQSICLSGKPPLLPLTFAPNTSLRTSQSS